MVDRSRHAPVAPETLSELVWVLDDPHSDTRAVASVVERDPGLLSRTLALANSAWYGMARRVDDATLAVGLVGRQTVRTIAVSGVTGLLDRDGLADIRAHALEVATAARALAPAAGVMPSVAFTAAILHDLGELLLWQEHGSPYLVARDAAVDSRHQRQIEVELYGADHSTVAAEHLLRWRFPEDLVVAVLGHHDPEPGAPRAAIVIAAADELTHRYGTERAEARGDRSSGPLRLLGLDEAQARAIAEQAAGEGAELLAALT